MKPCPVWLEIAEGQLGERDWIAGNSTTGRARLPGSQRDRKGHRDFSRFRNGSEA
jgi:hypothetical protein